MRAPRTKRKTHFVPKAIFRTAFAGVVPLCVATACGGAVTGSATNENDAAGDAGTDGALIPPNGGVGCAAFCGVALVGFDSGPYYDVAESGFGNPSWDVAAEAFGGNAGDSPLDVADATFGDEGDATPLDGGDGG